MALRVHPTMAVIIQLRRTDEQVMSFLSLALHTQNCCQAGQQQWILGL